MLYFKAWGRLKEEVQGYEEVFEKKWFEGWVILGPAENMRTCWEDFYRERGLNEVIRMWQKRHVWEMLCCQVNQRVGNMGRLLWNGSRQVGWGQIMNVLGQQAKEIVLCSKDIGDSNIYFITILFQLKMRQGNYWNIRTICTYTKKVKKINESEFLEITIITIRWTLL